MTPPLSTRLYDRLFQRLRGTIAKDTERRLDAHFRQTEAVLALYAALQPRLPLPATREWAASPDFACELVREIVRIRPQRVLELGSGVSTLVTAYVLEKLGGGILTSLDHELEWMEKSAEDVRLHGLGHVAALLCAPLKDVTIGDEVFPWYDLTVLPEGPPFDLLVVDGPPATLHPLARYPALPLLMRLLSPKAVIVLDDAARPAEREIVERWQREYGPFTLETPRTEKGMAILRRA